MALDSFYINNFYHKFSLEISVEKLKKGIKDSDFLISDMNSTHHFIGLKYNFPDVAPVITFVCYRHEMATAKQIAFSLGKLIYSDRCLLSILLSKYHIGEELEPTEFQPVARLYARYIKAKKIKIWQTSSPSLHFEL